MVLEMSKKRQRHLPGEPGIWVIIFGDMVVFSLFFGVYLHSRIEQHQLFLASQAHLNQTFGVINTFFMLSSSWFVAMAVQAARRSMGRATPILFSCAIGCGVGFVFMKYLEYGAKIRAGIVLTTNDFFMYYYMLTGIHLMHVLIGMGVLAFLVHYSRGGRFEAHQVRNLESGASFWHVVDLLWIVLFALLYLIK
jgi:nitric oxide reductase NorE protein